MLKICDKDQVFFILEMKNRFGRYTTINGDDMRD